MRTLAVILLCGSLALASKWTSDDILLTERADSVAFSPDGKLAVYVKSQMDKEKGEAVSNLVLRHLAEGLDIALTRGADTYSSPKFSKDGKKLAFLTSRKAADAPGAAAGPAAGGGGSQVWLMDPRGGEAWQLTRFEQGVRQFEWLDDNTLLLVAAEDPTLFAQKVKERKDTSQVVEDEQHAPPVRLFKYDVKGRQATRLTDNLDRINRLTVSDDGAWAVTLHDRSLAYVYNQKVRPATWLHDLKKGTHTQLFTDDKTLPQQIQFAKDSKSFYFTAPYTTHPKYNNAAISLLYQFDLAAMKESRVNLDWERGIAMGFAVTPQGVYAMLADGAQPKLAFYAPRAGGGWERKMIESPHQGAIFGMEFAEDGKQALYRHAKGGVPPQWYLAKVDGGQWTEAKPITELNAGWKKKAIARVEVAKWKGALNEEIEGILYYPHGYEKGKKYPLVVMIHGGPHGADFDTWSDSWGYPHQLFAQRGAFVLKPNYHGSSQYGLKFGESIAGGNYNELEWIDVERGVDALIARGLADPEKLGVMGWSNGSIITIELTTRTTRYKVASAGAGDVNWISDWGNCLFGDAFDQYYIGKTPLEDPMLYIKKSPLFRMDKVRTPTIIFFGTEDKQVPTEQGWQHYRALQHVGKTDVRFLLFPGEAHGPRKYVHQRRKMEEELEWFDKHLFGTAKDQQEALKPDSPLSALLKIRKSETAPDMVERGGIAIGRFEVTRAQYKQFDPAYPVAPGAERHPATGISFERAQAYCQWLSAKMGQPYRLGTEDEMRGLLKASKSENTLDAWAGYTVNPDDAKRLASLVEGLGEGALLKPVGSYPASAAGDGEDPLYDLAGNAAEWVVAKDGSGKALGGSADRPVDAKSSGAARADYVGFRVVRGPAESPTPR